MENLVHKIVVYHTTEVILDWMKYSRSQHLYNFLSSKTATYLGFEDDDCSQVLYPIWVLNSLSKSPRYQKIKLNISLSPGIAWLDNVFCSYGQIKWSPISPILHKMYFLLKEHKPNFRYVFINPFLECNCKVSNSFLKWGLNSSYNELDFNFTRFGFLFKHNILL